MRKSTVGKVAQSGELDLIRKIRARAGRASVTALRLGIGDDCALLRPRRGEELAITTDLSIAGRHFRLDWHPPQSVGHRALARGLSDLAAMGARPIAAFLRLVCPANSPSRAAAVPHGSSLFLTVCSRWPPTTRPRSLAATLPSRPSPSLILSSSALFHVEELCSVPPLAPVSSST